MKKTIDIHKEYVYGLNVTWSKVAIFAMGLFVQHFCNLLLFHTVNVRIPVHKSNSRAKLLTTS